MECALCGRKIRSGKLVVGYDIGIVEDDGMYNPIGCLPANLCYSCALKNPLIGMSVEEFSRRLGDKELE